MPAVVSGTFTGIGQSASWQPKVSPFNAYVQAASFSGNSVQLERQLPGDTAWYIVSEDSAGTAAIYTQNFNGQIIEPNPQTLYRWNCTLWASNIAYRLGG